MSIIYFFVKQSTVEKSSGANTYCHEETFIKCFETTRNQYRIFSSQTGSFISWIPLKDLQLIGKSSIWGFSYDKEFV